METERAKVRFLRQLMNERGRSPSRTFVIGERARAVPSMKQDERSLSLAPY